MVKLNKWAGQALSEWYPRVPLRGFYFIQFYPFVDTPCGLEPLAFMLR